MSCSILFKLLSAAAKLTCSVGGQGLLPARLWGREATAGPDAVLEEAHQQLLQGP